MKNSEEISRVSRLRERYLNTPPAVCSERAKIRDASVQGL